MVIVPNALRDAILAVVDAAIEKAKVPHAERQAVREYAYDALLSNYDETGQIGELELTRNAKESEAANG